jgi:hypothetical protein
VHELATHWKLGILTDAAQVPGAVVAEIFVWHNSLKGLIVTLNV